MPHSASAPRMILYVLSSPDPGTDGSNFQTYDGTIRFLTPCQDPLWLARKC